MHSEFKVIDIGHKGYSIDKALVELEVAVSDCICLLYTSDAADE